MNSALARATVAVVAAASLAACSESHSIVPIAQNGNAAALAPAALQSQSSPCKIPKAWQFLGACQEFKLRPKGDTKTLGPYHGLTFMQHFSHISGSVAADGFVIGMGTSKADVTGTYNGFAFPFYGPKASCIDRGFNAVACPGTPVLYSLILNASVGWRFGLSATPEVRINSTGAFPGAKCEEAFLLYLPNSKQFAWQLLQIYGKPQDGAVKFKSESVAVALEPGQFNVFGFVCY